MSSTVNQGEQAEAVKGRSLAEIAQVLLDEGVVLHLVQLHQWTSLNVEVTFATISSGSIAAVRCSAFFPRKPIASVND